MTATDREREAMARALVLAQNGPRGVNPQVGALILSPTGDVLAESVPGQPEWLKGSRGI